MAKKNHIHMYELITLKASGRKVFKCMLVDCTHYLPERELVIGRKSLCHICKEPLVMTREHLEIKKPVCEPCRDIRAKRREAMIAVGRGGELLEEADAD